MRQILSGRSEAASGDADPKCIYHADGRDGFCVIVRCKLSAPALQKLRHLTCPMVARSIDRLQFSLVEQQPRRSELRGTGRRSGVEAPISARRFFKAAKIALRQY